MPIPVHLNCQAAITAARAALGGQLPESAIAAMEFHFRRWCPPGMFCAYGSADAGYVVVHLRSQGPDFLVQVSSDSGGRVTVDYAGPMPSPAPQATM